METRSAQLGRRAWHHTRRLVWPVLRQTLGWMFIVLGLIGLVLPLLQGVLFLVIGVMLVGRRNWLIRRTTVAFKRGLRRWARHHRHAIARPGRMALRAQHECSRQSRRLHRHFAQRAQRQVDHSVQ